MKNKEPKQNKEGWEPEIERINLRDYVDIQGEAMVTLENKKLHDYLKSFISTQIEKAREDRDSWWKNKIRFLLRCSLCNGNGTETTSALEVIECTKCEGKGHHLNYEDKNLNDLINHLKD